MVHVKYLSILFLTFFSFSDVRCDVNAMPGKLKTDEVASPTSTPSSTQGLGNGELFDLNKLPEMDWNGHPVDGAYLNEIVENEGIANDIDLNKPPANDCYADGFPRENCTEMRNGREDSEFVRIPATEIIGGETSTELEFVRGETSTKRDFIRGETSTKSHFIRGETSADDGIQGETSTKSHLIRGETSADDGIQGETFAEDRIRDDTSAGEDFPGESLAKKYFKGKTSSKRNFPDEILAKEVLNVKFKHCDVCSISFRYRYQFENHFRQKHPNDKTYKCPKCAYGTNHKMYLFRHFVKFHAEDQITTAAEISRRQSSVECPICKIRCPGVIALEKHGLAEHKGTAMISCGECGKTFTRRGTLARHTYEKHRARRPTERPLSCKFCQRRFDQSDVAKTHERGCAGKRHSHLDPFFPMVCAICGAAFVKARDLREHAKSRHRERRHFCCYYCEKTFANEPAMLDHVVATHPRREISPKKFARKFPRVCRHCNVEVKGFKAYEEHGVTHHPGEKMFGCGHCGEEFIRKTAVMRHLRNSHGQKYMRCPFCPKTYSRIDQFRIHAYTCRKKRSDMEM